jgi:hypothetical protein
MPRKLNTFVHVGELRYGPGDDVPAEAAAQITNPDVWVDDNQPRSLTPVEAERVLVDRPPTSGAGSGRDAWAAYATEQGVTVTDDMDRTAIIAAVDAGK